MIDVAILIPHNDMFMSNLTIMFNRSGAGVQVSCNHGMINLKYSAPPVMLVRIFFAVNIYSKCVTLFWLYLVSMKLKACLVTGIKIKMTNFGYQMAKQYQ